MGKIVELEAGDIVPEGSRFLYHKVRQGNKIGEDIVGHRGIFPFNSVLYRNVYEEIDVYVYDVPESQSKGGEG